jgi:hypothetical protein
MTRSAYLPDSSGWMVLTTAELILGIDVPNDSPLLAELWKLLQTPTDAGAALDVLTRAGISSAPPFVIVSLGAEAKVLVRGPAAVTVDGSEHEVVTGAGFSSWAERSFTRIERFSCDIAGAEIAHNATRLPLLSGASRAGWFGGDVSGIAVFGGAELAAETHAVAAAVAPAAMEPPVVSAPVLEAAVPTAPAAPASPVPPAPVSEATVVAVDEVDEEPEVVAPPEPPAAASPYDHLFGETAYRTVEDAAVRPIEEDESSAPPAIEDRTVVASDLAELRAKRRAGRGRTVVPEAPVAAFYVELSTGGQERLDQTLVIGRAPAATALGGGSIPRLVTMTTPNQDISRTHAQISVEGGAVVVTDLHSRNGTIVTLPGRAAQKLREGEATVVIPGTIVDLGDGATLTVREV